VEASSVCQTLRVRWQDRRWTVMVDEVQSRCLGSPTSTNSLCELDGR